MYWGTLCHWGHLRTAAAIWCRCGFERVNSIVVFLPTESLDSSEFFFKNSSRLWKAEDVYIHATSDLDCSLPEGYCFDVTSVSVDIQYYWLSTELDVTGHHISQHPLMSWSKYPSNYSLSSVLRAVCTCLEYAVLLFGLPGGLSEGVNNEWIIKTQTKGVLVQQV